MVAGIPFGASSESMRFPCSPAYAAGMMALERRSGHRYKTIFRLAQVTIGKSIGLLRVRNMSDGGLMLDATDAEPANAFSKVGDSLDIRLSENLSVTGQIVWAHNNMCGIKLHQQIDSIATLRSLAEHQRSGSYRRPRFDVNLAGVAYAADGTHSIRASDLSQHGIGIDHASNFSPGMHVRILLENGLERRGIVRWTHERRAGLLLIDPVNCHDLNHYLLGDRHSLI